MKHRTAHLWASLFFPLALLAQTPYSYTVPGQFQGVNYWTNFTFPATPPTTGGGTLTFQWLACWQPGFSASTVEMQFNTSGGWVTVASGSSAVECTYSTVNATIAGTVLADAIAFGNGSVLARVDANDGCQAGVGCTFYNDPVVTGITLSYTAHAANFSAPDPTVCPGATVSFTDASLNTPSSYEWHFPGGTPGTSAQQNPVVQYAAPGTYDVTLIVVTADGPDTLVRPGYVTVYAPPAANAGVDETVCAGASAQLQASGGVSYQWFPATALSSATIAAPVATPSSTTSYTVLVTDGNGCQASDYMILTVQPLPTVVASAGNNTICLGDTAYIVAVGAQLYQWSPNLFLSSTSGAAVFAWPTSTFSWTVTGTDGVGCTNDTTITLTVQPPPPGPTVSINGAEVTTAAAAGYQWYLNGQAIPGATAQSWTPLVNGNYSVAITDANGCSSQGLPLYYGTVGMAEATGPALHLYPRPVQDALRVDGLVAPTAARLLDARGRLAWQGTLSAGTATVPMGGLSSGAYILVVGTEAPQRFAVVKE